MNQSVQVKLAVLEEMLDQGQGRGSMDNQTYSKIPIESNNANGSLGMIEHCVHRGDAGVAYTRVGGGDSW